MSKHWINFSYDDGFDLLDSEPQSHYVYGVLRLPRQAGTIELTDDERADFDRVQSEWWDWQRRLGQAYNDTVDSDQ